MDREPTRRFSLLCGAGIRAGGPHDLRHRVSQLPKFRFDSTQNLLDTPTFGDVPREARHAFDLPVHRVHWKGAVSHSIDGSIRQQDPKLLLERHAKRPTTVGCCHRFAVFRMHEFEKALLVLDKVPYWPVVGRFVAWTYVEEFPVQIGHPEHFRQVLRNLSISLLALAWGRLRALVSKITPPKPAPHVRETISPSDDGHPLGSSDCTRNSYGFEGQKKTGAHNEFVLWWSSSFDASLCLGNR